jgi:hypothetical protein
MGDQAKVWEAQQRDGWLSGTVAGCGREGLLVASGRMGYWWLVEGWGETRSNRWLSWKKMIARHTQLHAT